MSDIQLTIVLAAIVPTLAALGALMVSVINAIKSNANGVKADDIIKKAEQIHTLTNSNLSKVTASLEVANAKIDGLQLMVAEMTKAKAIADTVAEKAAEKVPAIAAPVTPPAPTEVVVVNEPTDPVPTTTTKKAP